MYALIVSTVAEFKVLEQSNFLVKVDGIPDGLGVGDVYGAPNGAMFQVVYIDREVNELGIIPVRVTKQKER